MQNTPRRARDYPYSLVEKITSEVKFSERKAALQQRGTVWKNSASPNNVPASCA